MEYIDPVVQMYLDRDENGREKARNQRKPAMRFRASGLTDCKRQEFYRQSGWIEKPRYGYDDDYGVDGDVHHDVVRQLMLAHGIKLAGITQAEDGSTHEDMFVKHDFDVDGRTITVSTRQDGWIYHPQYGWMLMEIKSAGHWPFHYMEKSYQHGWTNELGIELPAGHDTALAYLQEKKPEYMAQINAGLAISRARGVDKLPFPSEDKYTLDHAYLVLKDRSMCHIGYHSGPMPILGGIIVPYSVALLDKTLQRCYVTKGKILDGTPPIPEYPAGSKQCSWCKFKYACHDADKRRKLGESPAIVYPDPAIHVEFEPDAEEVRQANDCGPVRKDRKR